MHAGMDAALGMSQELNQLAYFGRLADSRTNGRYDIPHRAMVVDAEVGGADSVDGVL